MPDRAGLTDRHLFFIRSKLLLCSTMRARRLRHYQRSLALLEERLPESRLVGQLRDELRSFLRERAMLTGAS